MVRGGGESLDVRVLARDQSFTKLLRQATLRERGPFARYRSNSVLQQAASTCHSL